MSAAAPLLAVEDDEGVADGGVAAQVLAEHFPEDLGHEAVDEEVDGAVDDHEQLGDGAEQVDPEGQVHAAVVHVLLVLLDCEDLEGEKEGVNAEETDCLNHN